MDFIFTQLVNIGEKLEKYQHILQISNLHLQRSFNRTSLNHSTSHCFT